MSRIEIFTAFRLLFLLLLDMYRKQSGETDESGFLVREYERFMRKAGQETGL